VGIEAWVTAAATSLLSVFFIVSGRVSPGILSTQPGPEVPSSSWSPLGRKAHSPSLKWAGGGSPREVGVEAVV
jgi:hypothetical protein